MATVRSSSLRSYEFACHSAACAPPPTGTGGSKGGAGGSPKAAAASNRQKLVRQNAKNQRELKTGSSFVGKPKAAAAPAKKAAAAPAKAAASGGTPKGKIQSEEHSKKVTGSGGKAALVQTSKYKDGSTEIHVERTNSKYYGESTTVTIKSKGKTLAKVFNDDDPAPSKKAVGRMLEEAKEWERYGSKSGIDNVAGNLINEGGWQDYGP